VIINGRKPRAREKKVSLVLVDALRASPHAQHKAELKKAIYAD
jgi:hypothetical protein